MIKRLGSDLTSGTLDTICIKSQRLEENILSLAVITVHITQLNKKSGYFRAPIIFLLNNL